MSTCTEAAVEIPRKRRGIVSGDRTDGTPPAAEWSAGEAIGRSCSRPGEDFPGKKQESGERDNIEDYLSNNIDPRPASDGQIRSHHASERRTKGGCEAMHLAPNRARCPPAEQYECDHGPCGPHGDRNPKRLHRLGNELLTDEPEPG